MTAQFPALEATIISAKPPIPSLERPRLYVDGEILPALYHYAARTGGSYWTETIVSAQHEIDAAKEALKNEAIRERAIEAGSLTIAGMDERGGLGEYPVTIRVDLDGCVAISP